MSIEEMSTNFHLKLTIHFHTSVMLNNLYRIQLILRSLVLIKEIAFDAHVQERNCSIPAMIIR